MTKEQKKERRQVRHELQAVAKRSLSRDFRLITSLAQQKAAAKVIADAILSDKYHGTVETREQ